MLGSEKPHPHLKETTECFSETLRLTIFVKKGEENPSFSITASLTEHSDSEYPRVHFIDSAQLFRLFADGSEIIHHQQKFENSPFSGERGTRPTGWRPNN